MRAGTLARLIEAVTQPKTLIVIKLGETKD